LRRTVASTGGTLLEVSTRTTKLSQFCHGCGKTLKKPLSQRWHQCPCGVGPVQRDLYSAFLAAYLDPADPIPSCAQYVIPWEGAEARLRLAHERVQQRANEGQNLPRSMGHARARARRPESQSEPTPEPAFSLRRGRLEAWKERENPRGLSPGSTQNALKVTKMMDGVYEMKEFDSVTLWLIEGDDKCLLIDTGMGLTDLPTTIDASRSTSGTG